MGGAHPRHAMRCAILLVLCSAASAFLVTSPIITRRSTRHAVREATSNPFTEQFEGISKKIRSIIEELTPADPPSASDIDEYCRDESSSGCDVEMLEELLREARRKEIKGIRGKKVEWSERIDDAVEA